MNSNNAKAWLMVAATMKVMVMAQNCNPNLPPAHLCNSPTQVIQVPEQCVTQQLVIADFQPCCNLAATANNNGCPTEVGDRQCRFAEISAPVCTDTGAAECRASQLTMEIETFQQGSSCCEQCGCWGDPHCHAFSGQERSWFICESRVKGKNGCRESKNKCLATKDPNGRDCIWQNEKDEPWNIALQGSQCTYNHANGYQPEMTLYRFPGFLTLLYLGERGIIDGVQIAQGSKDKFIMTAENCFDTPNMPWRSSIDAKNPPTDPDWLPKSWTRITRDGDYIWRTSGLTSGVQITVQCTRNKVRVNGEVKFGMPRLTVDLVEPVKDRSDASGFCESALFDIELDDPNALKGSATLQDTCLREDKDLMIAKEICSQATTERDIASCKRKFCGVARPTDSGKCVNDIKRYSWAKTFCAAFTMHSKNPGLCGTDSTCNRCLDDISDFGWGAAITKYMENSVVPVVDIVGCIPPQELPEDLIGCDRGILIQYQDDTTKEWITYRAIREGQTVCTTGPGQFNQNDNPELFINRIRFAQCGSPLNAQCKPDDCQPEMGFSAKLNYFIEPDVNNLQEMVQEDLLICNPEMYPPGSKDCLNETFPPLCPNVCKEKC